MSIVIVIRFESVYIYQRIVILRGVLEETQKVKRS